MGKKKKRQSSQEIDVRRLLYDHPDERSLTSLFAVAVHEFKEAGLLNKFEEILEKVGSKNSQEFRLLRTYIQDADSVGKNDSKGYQTIVIDLNDLETIRKYSGPFKRALSKLILEKFNSYLEFANKAQSDTKTKLDASNISKFLNPQNNSKPKKATMDKFIRLLNINEIPVKVYPNDIHEK